MKYEYICHNDQIYIEVTRSIHDEPKEEHCPICGEPMRRLYAAPPIHYHCQGFHTTDYNKHGDKLEQLNKNWSRYYNEEPPKPASDVPRNSSEPY